MTPWYSLRTLAYKYQWFYDTVSGLATLTVGGENNFRSLALKNLDITPDTKILDLCCGAGQTTKFLVNLSKQVTGLDASLNALTRAKKNVPQANYIEGLAEAMPLDDEQFDLVHSSAAMHEMTTDQLQGIFREVYRILKPNGVFTFIDLHQPTNPLFIPGIIVFLSLFETETAWHFLQLDVIELLETTGFKIFKHQLYAGGSLQVIQCQK
jgi:ubiquinone/menaquinone biosynthesis C-methylase UbiE